MPTDVRITAFRIGFVCLLLLITVLTLIPSTGHVGGGGSDKVAHLLAFYALALTLDFAFPSTAFSARKVLFLLGYGLAIELMQALTVYRTFSLLDLTADALGLACYAATLHLLTRLPPLRWRVALLRR